MYIIFRLFLSFLKIGAFSFGGGYAMLPFIEREIVTSNKWLSMPEFMDIIGISQMTPGPVAINSATFVGYKMEGIWGSIAATIGVVITSFILVSIISRVLTKFKNSVVIKSALLGMRPVLIALILSAFLGLAKESYVDLKSIVITLIIGGLLLSKKIHPILIIMIAAVLGVIFYI